MNVLACRHTLVARMLNLRNRLRTLHGALTEQHVMVKGLALHGEFIL